MRRDIPLGELIRNTLMIIAAACLLLRLFIVKFLDKATYADILHVSRGIFKIAILSAIAFLVFPILKPLLNRKIPLDDLIIKVAAASFFLIAIVMGIWGKAINPNILRVIAVILIVPAIAVLVYKMFPLLKPLPKVRKKKAKKSDPMEAVHYYRQMGFFEKFSNLSDEELVNKLREVDEFSMKSGEDLDLLSIDKDRVWWEDMEADVFAENKVYVDTLKGWSRIARGAFKPTKITETWRGEEGPVKVEFTLDGIRHCINPEFLEDWLDLEPVLKKVNELILGSGYQFMVSNDIGDQTAYIVVLTEEEKEKLKHERELEFV